ncbi:sensor histidine kinase [Actinoplanes utahensis]|uniref:histidine kinase n=1 Tax=Actinoplanes utahensis TaxID=1869 RepID=A0A0A6UMU7_ACTUT|nr:sensor histidine kinase [Actinoplanes utahensis]KHD75649.1 histidine kinase [Actinoplanes utahensis]GIF27187.1 histidine kinase [Actinoplanes utahensis]
MRRRVRIAVDALEHLVGGLGTSILAMAGLFWLLAVVVSSLVGVGLPLIGGSLRAVRSIADRERGRLSRWGPAIVGPPPVPDRPSAALRDPAVRRELAWVPVHATFGFAVGIFGLSLPLSALQDLTYPLWYHLAPPGEGAPGIPFWNVDSLAEAFGVALAGLGWLAVLLLAGGALARSQAWPGRRLLGPVPGADLSLRVAELTATRAAALDAHAAELRRIERSLHDGTQNRLVAVTVLLGAARRAYTRDPATGAELLDRAQQAAEEALGELRTVVRGILPPVLDDRGLAGALDGLVAGCALPCDLAVELPVRCAVSVEATAYFVVAEALTNAVRHSGATAATVSVRVDGDRLLIGVGDDGRGGADESAGSGLAGIRRRVEAHDGRFTLTSPPGGPTTMDVELPCGS